MNIDWVIACRLVEVHDNLGTIVGAGADTFWVLELPAPIQVALAVRLLAMHEELGEDEKHAMSTRVRNPSGDLISEASGEVGVVSDTAQEEWLTGIILPALVQFQAEEEGVHMIEFTVDDASAHLAIRVVHGLPPGVEPPAG